MPAAVSTDEAGEVGRGPSVVSQAASTYGYSVSISNRVQAVPGGVDPSAQSSSIGFKSHSFSLSDGLLQALVPDLASAPAKPAAAFQFEGDLRAIRIRDVMMRFQSLGDNCEFGLLQRRAKAEPLDLLRFAGFNLAGVDLLRQTTRAVADGFDGIGEPGSVICTPHGPRLEFMVQETRWKLNYHSGLHEGEITPDELSGQQALALQFRRREFLSDLQAAERIYVWKSKFDPTESDIRALVASLRSHGPNLLLWVGVEDADHPAGLVEYAGDGLMRGYIRRFAPYVTAYDIEYDSWFTMCRNAGATADRLRQLGEWGRSS
jgi:hypothetical protein